MVFCILDTGYKPDENQIRDHQAELEGAYNELLQLAAARRARLDESHKLQSFYRDAEEEEMWVSEKAHSLQSTDYGHDLNSAMILLNKHEVCGNYFSVTLIPDVRHDCIVNSFFFSIFTRDTKLNDASSCARKAIFWFTPIDQEKMLL